MHSTIDFEIEANNIQPYVIECVMSTSNFDTSCPCKSILQQLGYIEVDA
jgi:hypothetical protein